MSEAKVVPLRIDDPGQVKRAAGRRSKVIEIPEGAEWNAVEEAIFRRRSIRRYKRQQVPPHLIRRMLEAGRFAPSQGNCQPWKFVVIRDADLIRGMEDFCVATAKKFSEGLDYVRYERGSFKHLLTRAKAKLFNRMQPNMLHPVPVTALTAIAEGRFAVFHHAPTVLLLLMDKRGIGSPEIDIGICGQNIVLTAQSFGLGTCWVGFSKFLNQSAEWCARLGVEEPYEIAEAITVGYPVGNPTNLIARDTHEIAWFEGGANRVLY